MCYLFYSSTHCKDEEKGCKRKTNSTVGTRWNPQQLIYWSLLSVTLNMFRNTDGYGNFMFRFYLIGAWTSPEFLPKHLWSRVIVLRAWFLDTRSQLWVTKAFVLSTEILILRQEEIFLGVEKMSSLKGHSFCWRRKSDDIRWEFAQK